MLTKDPMQRCGWMEIFTINIDSNGRIQNGEMTPKIRSLDDAKSSNEGVFTNSNKMIPKQVTNTEICQPNTGNFKKAKSHNASNASNAKTYTSDSQSTEKSYLAREHKQVVEGGKLAMEIMQAKVPNNMGYGYLVLSRTHKILTDMQPKINTSDLKQIIEREANDIKYEMDQISANMFQYEQKGL